MTLSLSLIETTQAPFDFTEQTVVAFVDAHPDDEHTKIAAIEAAQNVGATIISIVATNGEASDRGGRSFLENDGRLWENRAVWEQFGVPPEQQLHFRLPDGGLHLTHNRPRLEFALATAIVRHNITTIITPGEDGFDGHDDHRAVHAATLAAASRARKWDGRQRSVWGLNAETPDFELPVNTNRVLGTLALNRSQFKIITATPHTSAPDGWIRQGDYFISNRSAELLRPYEQFITSHEGYLQYA